MTTQNLDPMNRVISSVKSISPYSVPKIECSIKLDGNESPFNLSENIERKIIKELGNVDINRYPDPDCLELRKKIQENEDFSLEGILLGNGSDELIQMLISSLTGKSGVVLVPAPTFSMYKLTSLAFEKEVVEVELEESFDLDLDLIKEIIRNYDPDLFFFSSPNNPTGNSFSRKRIIEIVESTDGIVVVDEAYIDYFGETFLPLINNNKNLAVLRTMSKIGFAAVRLGILFVNPELATEINKVRLPYNINSLTQKIGEIAFDNYDFLLSNFKIIKNERKRLFSSLCKFKDIVVYPSDANFFLVRVNDADKVFNDLVEKDILVRNLNKQERLENCLRITIGTPEENDALINAFSTIFSS